MVTPTATRRRVRVGSSMSPANPLEADEPEERDHRKRRQQQTGCERAEIAAVGARSDTGAAEAAADGCPVPSGVVAGPYRDRFDRRALRRSGLFGALSWWRRAGCPARRRGDGRRWLGCRLQRRGRRRVRRRRRRAMVHVPAGDTGGGSAPASGSYRKPTSSPLLTIVLEIPCGEFAQGPPPREMKNTQNEPEDGRH